MVETKWTRTGEAGYSNYGFYNAASRFNTMETLIWLHFHFYRSL